MQSHKMFTTGVIKCTDVAEKGAHAETAQTALYVWLAGGMLHAAMKSTNKQICAHGQAGGTKQNSPLAEVLPQF